MPECLICHKIFTIVSGRHLTDKHNINTKQYKELFPNAKVITEDLTMQRSNFFKNHNPMFEKDIAIMVGRKHSEVMKGCIPWNKGIKGVSVETSEKMRQQKLGKPSNRKGAKCSEESKQKNRIRHLGKKNPNKPKYTKEQCKHISDGLKKFHLESEVYHGWGYESPEHLNTKIKISEALQFLGYTTQLERYIRVNNVNYAIDIYAFKINSDPLLFEVGSCDPEKLFNLQSRYPFVFNVSKI